MNIEVVVGAEFWWRTIKPEEQTQSTQFLEILVSKEIKSYQVHRICVSKGNVKISFSLELESGTFQAEDVLYHNGLEDFDIVFDPNLRENLKEALINEIEERISRKEEDNPGLYYIPF